METSRSVPSCDSGKAKMQTLACWEPASTVNVLLLSLIRNMWGPGIWGRITSRSVRIFTSSSPCCMPTVLCASLLELWRVMEDASLVSTQHETLKKEVQTLESRSPNFCSVSLGKPVAVNKGKLNCPGMIDRQWILFAQLTPGQSWASSRCSFTHVTTVPLLFIPALLLPGSWVHMLTTDSVPDIVRQHLHFNQTCQRSVSMLRLEKSSSVLFLHHLKTKEVFVKLSMISSLWAFQQVLSHWLPGNLSPNRTQGCSTWEELWLLFSCPPHPLFFSTHGNYCSILFFPSKKILTSFCCLS